ncbi:MAG: AmmeMemoRadiSam system radical SAM enzyme [Spirochaetaceae bacterium]|nr:AmmeMemoRadiSam system radical SAM enzyme [Spirochaetaceae bacterium]
MKPKYFKAGASGFSCGLCPHACSLAEGKRGLCTARGVENNEPCLPAYARLSGIALDPIEKKPLYHFLPGGKILSAGFYGCNLRCPFCQNHHISRGFSGGGNRVSPADLARKAGEDGSVGVAYTYSEPLIHFEYLVQAAREVRARGLRNVLVSNGYLNEEPARELLPLLDAANIDLKSFSDDFYSAELGGGLRPVLRFIELAAQSLHLEVTTLIIPGKNDSAAEMEKIAAFLAGLSQDIPLHLSCYRPMYRYTARPAVYEDLLPLLEAARKKLRYVYPGNVNQEANTLCPACGELLVRRQGYSVRVTGLQDDRCRCGQAIAGIWQA